MDLEYCAKCKTATPKDHTALRHTQSGRKFILCTKCGGEGPCQRTCSRHKVVCTRGTALATLDQTLARQKKQTLQMQTLAIAIGALCLFAVVVVLAVQNHPGLNTVPIEPARLTGKTAAPASAIQFDAAKQSSNANPPQKRAPLSRPLPAMAPQSPVLETTMYPRQLVEQSGPVLAPEDFTRIRAATSPEKTAAGSADEVVTAEPSWWLRWEFNHLDGNAKAEMHASLDGNAAVLETCPAALTENLVFSARLLVPENRPILEFAAHAQERGEFNLSVMIDGKRILAEALRGPDWQSYALDLSSLARKEVNVSFEQAALTWPNANAFWLAPLFVSKPNTTSKIVDYRAVTAQRNDSGLLVKQLLNAPAAPQPERFANLKLEYERTVSDALSLLREKGLSSARECLETALNEPSLRPVRTSLRRDLACLNLLTAADEAAANAVRSLDASPAFALHFDENRELQTGQGSHNRVSLDGRTLVVATHVPGGSGMQRIPFDALTPQTRFELVCRGMPANAEGSLKLAVAGVALWQSGKGRLIPKDIRPYLDSARKDTSLAELANTVGNWLALLERAQNATYRFQQIELSFKQQNWPQTRAQIDSFRQDFMNTYPLARLEPRLQEIVKRIPQPLLGLNALN